MSTDAMSISTSAPTISSDKPKRYHPALVALHWIIFLLIFATALLGMAGGEGGEGRRGSLIPGFPTLEIHMILGITVLILLIVRLIVRWRAKSPAWASTGNSFLDFVGVLTHWALYFFTFVIVITGIILAMQGNRLARTFGLASSTPPQFAPGQFQPRQFPPNGQFQPGQFPRPGGVEGGFEGGFGRGNFFTLLGRLHGVSWALFFLLIVFHAGAAFYHQFFVKDDLLGRMWFGKRYG